MARSTSANAAGASSDADCLERVEDQIAADQAEHRHDIVHRDRVAGKGANLIERAQRIAHAAFAGARQQQECLVGNLDLFLDRR